MAALISTWSDYWNQNIAYGLQITIITTLIGTVLTVVWGAVVAGMRTSRVGIVSFAATFYIELIRGTPILVQLFALFFAIPILTGFGLPAFPTVILALTLNAGSYMAESYRSGLEAVPRGQREAAAAMGMGRWISLRRVVIPEAIRIVLPAIGNMTVSILLTSPIAGVIGNPDLLYQAGVVHDRTDDFSVYFFVSIVYAAMALALSAGNSWLEARLRLP